MSTGAQPSNGSGTSTSPTPRQGWATLVYDLTSGKKGPWSHAITLAETNMAANVVRVGNGQSSAYNQPASPPAGVISPSEQSTLTVQGVSVIKSITGLGNQRIITSYSWKNAGLSFEMNLFGTGGGDQVATPIITDTLK